MSVQSLRIGHLVPSDYQAPRGECDGCGGECDGDDCGKHAAGCMYGGFGYGYWLIAKGCPLDHGPATCVVRGCCA